VVGISRDRPTLHVFGSAARPETPLVLEKWEWERLLHSKGSIRLVVLKCGDHASEERFEDVLRIDKKGIHVIAESFACQSGRRLSRETG